MKGTHKLYRLSCLLPEWHDVLGCYLWQWGQRNMRSSNDIATDMEPDYGLQLRHAAVFWEENKFKIRNLSKTQGLVSSF